VTDDADRALQPIERRLANATAERDRLYALITPVLLTIVQRNLPTSPDPDLVRQYRAASEAVERAQAERSAFLQARMKPDLGEPIG
jgi:hypothetical protein